MTIDRPAMTMEEAWRDLAHRHERTIARLHRCLDEAYARIDRLQKYQEDKVRRAITLLEETL
jgi:hypothetical protein